MWRSFERFQPVYFCMQFNVSYVHFKYFIVSLHYDVYTVEMTDILKSVVLKLVHVGANLSGIMYTLMQGGWFCICILCRWMIFLFLKSFSLLFSVVCYWIDSNRLSKECGVLNLGIDFLKMFYCTVGYAFSLGGYVSWFSYR